MISQKEVERCIQRTRALTTIFIKQLKKISNPKQRKAIGTSAVLDIMIEITDNTVEAVGLLEYAKQILVSFMEDKYALKSRGTTRPSEAIV